MNPPTDQQQEQPPSSSTSPFESLSSYPFTSDPEFAKGLSIILGHPNTPASVDEINSDNDLVLQAKCFYFSKFVPLLRWVGLGFLSGVEC